MTFMKQEPDRRRRDYFFVSLASFLNSIGSNLQSSIWPFYLQLSNVSEATYGLFNTISSLAGIITRAAGAKLSARGESLTLVVGILVSICARLAYATAPAPITILLGMILASVAMALVMMGRTLLVRSTTSSERRATSYGIVGTLADIGMVLAINLGVFIFVLIGYSGLFLLGASISSLALLPALSLPRKKSIAAKGSLLPLSMLRKASPALRRFYLATALDSFSWAIAAPFFAITPAIIFSATKEQIALMHSLIWGTAIATTIMVASISDKMGSRKAMMVFSEALGVVCFGLYVLAQSIFPLYVCSVLFGLVMVTWGPITSAYITEITEHHEIHEAVGTWMTVTAVARIPSPFIGGLLAEAWHPKAPYIVALPLVGLITVIIQRTLVEPKRPAYMSNPGYPTSRPAAA